MDRYTYKQLNQPIFFFFHFLVEPSWELAGTVHVAAQ